MSFSSDVKIELSELSTLKNKQAVYMELLGYLSSKNAKINNTKLKFSTTNEYSINRFSKLLSNLNMVNFKINLDRKTYTITDMNKNEKDILNGFSIFKILDEKNLFLIEIQDINNKRDELKKAYIRGCFLGGGSITNPKNHYHLEMNFNNFVYANYVSNILNEFGITMKMLHNSSETLYMKEGEEISKFLALVGASKNVLKFEEVRVVRDMKNNVNRLVNCETANMNKTINISVEQLSYIKKLKDAKKFHLLSENLQEIANLREKYPNATLEELGYMLKKPIGKSSVNSRFKKIKLLSEELCK